MSTFTVSGRVHDAASDCLRHGFSLDDEIDIGGYCIDRPSLSPAGSGVYAPLSHYGSTNEIG